METDELIKNVIRWGRDKGLNDPKAQLNKVIEEVGEIAHEVSRNRYGEEFRDAIGDTLVTLIILADIASARPMACLELAYREIKDRKGKTENGTFVKDVEKSYKIVAEGPGRECLTWSDADNLEDTKRCLMEQGYESFKIEEERLHEQ